MCEENCTCCYCKAMALKIKELTSAEIEPKFKVDQMVYIINNINEFGHIKKIYTLDGKITYKVKGKYDRFFNVRESDLLGIEKQKYSISDTVKLLVNDYVWTVLGSEESKNEKEGYYTTFQYKLKSVEDPSVVIYRYQYELRRYNKYKSNETTKKSWFQRIFS